jgi:hypothetical protein
MIRSSAFTLFQSITTTVDKEILSNTRSTEHPIIINSRSEHEGHTHGSRPKARRRSSRYGSRTDSSKPGTILNFDGQSSQKPGL